MADKELSIDDAFSATAEVPVDDFYSTTGEISVDDAFEGAQRGVAPSPPEGMGSAGSPPSGASAFDFITRPGTPGGMARGYVGRAAKHTGEGMTAAHDSMGDRVRRAATPGPAPWEDFGSYAADQGQKLIDMPMMGLDALSFVARPFLGPIEQGISDVTGGVVTPEAAGTALMGLGPKGGMPKPMPRGPRPSGPQPGMKDITPPGPPKLPQQAAPASTPAPAPPAIAKPPELQAAAEAGGDITKYSPEMVRGQMSHLDKKITRAQEALREIEGSAQTPETTKILATLKESLAKWGTERAALAGAAAEMPGTEITVTPPPKGKGEGRKAKAAVPSVVTFEDGGTVPVTGGNAPASPTSGAIPLPANAAAATQPLAAANAPPGGGAVPPTGGNVPPPGGVPPAPPAPPAGAAPPAGTPPGRPTFTGPATAPRPLPPTIVEVAKWGPKKIEQLLSPTTVDELSQLGEAVFRKERGVSVRETEQARAAMEHYGAIIRTTDEATQLDIADYIETRSAPGGPRTSIAPELQPFADAQRALMQQIQNELQALPSAQKMSFVTDFYSHLWDNPTNSANFVRQYGVGKEGSGGFTKSRSVPTISEGLAAGLKLKTTNPIDATMIYAENAYRFIAHEKAFQTFRDLGFAKPFTPGKQPAGWMPLEGRKAALQTQFGPETYYAPENLALVYNNAVSRDLQGISGDVLHAAQRAANFVTALELTASGFHFATMGQEAIANGFANAFINALRGRPILAGKQALKALSNPVSYGFTGGRTQRAYLNSTAARGPMEKFGDVTGRALGQSDAEISTIADLLTQVGGRAVHMDSVYLNSMLGDYVSAWKRGALKTQMLADWQDVKGRPVTGTATVVARHMSRLMDTVMKPLFQIYIPKIKAGAFADNMGQWLKRNPNASAGDQLAAAREIWDSIDNRFGEMARDNIFWKQTHKQAAQVSLRSWSWTIGFLREFGGGLWDAGKLPFTATQEAGRLIEGKAKGPGLSERIEAASPGGRFTPTRVTGRNVPGARKRQTVEDLMGTRSKNDPKFSQKMAYVLGLPMAYVVMNAIIQYMFTGEKFRDTHDAIAPRTGGILEDRKGDNEERIVAPGFMKDVFGWYTKGIQGELYAKMSTAPRTAIEVFSNKDWRDMPIAPRSLGNELFAGGEDYQNPEAPSWASAMFDHVLESLGPFSVKQIVRGQERGSEIGPVMTGIGFQPTGMALTDPERYDRGKKRHDKSDWKRKERADRREEQRYNGPD